MTFLPSVVQAEYQGSFQIRFTFNDNSERTVDFCPWLDGPIIEPLKDPKYFRRFFLEGGAVAWPNGADIAPETLYEAGVREKQPARQSQRTKPRASAKKPAPSRKETRSARSQAT